MTTTTAMDVRIELVPVPVTDIDRAKAFYVDGLGFVADHDHRVHETLRFVQLTPPGSACSIVIGQGITEKTPGTEEIQVVVEDVAAVREVLVERGVEASEIDHQPWGDFIYVSDPDGNHWSYQQLPEQMQP
jgi:catechol 2,3-dioxygenase-like lactoylglutathione lyase family enzyme